MQLCRYVAKLYHEEKREENRINVIALVASGKRVFGYGINDYTAMNKMARDNNYWSIHAEIAAITAANKVDGNDLYVYREYARGGAALAMPCSICMNLIGKVGIRRVYYSIPLNPFWMELRL